ncbi:MAG: prepilin-type N-terminal cleavage/methylation domain-containing protein [Planctomycetota bacterium]
MSRRRAFQPGYTLLELLVVIVIASLLVGIAIPAFRAILSSSRRSLAESKLQQALYSARDAATASVGGGDAAAVFFFEPGKGIRVLTCIEIGSIEDEVSGGLAGSGGGGSGPANRRDVFVPLPGFEPVQLPSGIGVRGFALGSLFVGRSNWYESLDSRAGNRVPPEPGYWVFPETAFYPENELDGGDVRQTFMVRFSAGEGTLSREPTRALIVSPSTGSDTAVTDLSGINTDIENINEIDDLELWARRALSNVDVTDEDRRVLFGNESVHTVLAGPVTELSLYEERDLSRAVGGRGLNQDTDTLYLAGEGEPVVDRRIYDRGERLLVRNASRWIEGRELIGSGVPQTDSTAQVFAVNAFFGDLVEITR